MRTACLANVREPELQALAVRNTREEREIREAKGEEGGGIGMVGGGGVAAW